MTKDKFGKVDIPDFLMLLSMLITIIFSIFLLARYDLQITKKNKYPVTISTDNAIYECNKTTNNLYLGKTDNWVFVKLSSSNSTLCLPISDIEKMEFK